MGGAMTRADFSKTRFVIALVVSMIAGLFTSFMAFAAVISSKLPHPVVFLPLALPSGGLLMMLIGISAFPKGSDRRLGCYCGGAAAALISGGCVVAMMVR